MKRNQFEEGMREFVDEMESMRRWKIWERRNGRVCVCREVEKKAARIKNAKKRVRKKQRVVREVGEECCKLVGQKEVSGWWKNSTKKLYCS